jgi:hypothetical protein
MPGKPGSGGPVPKRSDQRRRRNKPDVAITKATSQGAATAPEPSEDWHPIARAWYDALRESGQSQFYEASDWATAVYVAEAMSRNLNQGRFSAQLFQSVMSAMTDLMTTEGARRRARVELERGVVDDTEDKAKVTRMEAYRKAAGTS